MVGGDDLKREIDKGMRGAKVKIGVYELGYFSRKHYYISWKIV